MKRRLYSGGQAAGALEDEGEAKTVFSHGLGGRDGGGPCGRRMCNGLRGRFG